MPPTRVSDDDDANRNDAAGRDQRDAGANNRQNGESETGSDPESTTDESDDEQTSTSESGGHWVRTVTYPVSFQYASSELPAAAPRSERTVSVQ